VRKHSAAIVDAANKEHYIVQHTLLWTMLLALFILVNSEHKKRVPILQG